MDLQAALPVSSISTWRLVRTWARAGPYLSWRWRLGPARFGSYDDASIATAQAACHAPASEAVTDVTDCFSSNPLFFGHRVIDVQSVKTSAAHDHLVQKIVLTAIVDQAHNSNKRPLLRGPTDKPPFGWGL